MCCVRHEAWGAINAQGDWAIPPKFDALGDFREGHALARRLGDGAVGVVDETGAWVAPPVFRRDSEVSRFSGGLAFVGRTGLDADGSRATSPIRWDWEGRWAAGEAEVEFDEAAQACSATVPYEPLWFEACEGDKVYLYEWTADGWTYAGEADGSAKVTYENLVGDYTLSGSADLQAITRFVVESVDADGAISATATWVADEKCQDRRELAVPMEGTVMSCAKPDGTHRVLATLDGWTDDGFYLGVSFVADDSMYGSESNTVKSIRLDYTIEERTYDGAYYVTGFNSMGDFEVVEDKKAAA